LPAGLPDEQLVLMVGYLEIRREENDRSSKGRVAARARSAEQMLQAAEADAWQTSRR